VAFAVISICRASFSSHVNDSLVRQMADAMVANGLVDAGYEYISGT
jgi:hypothetical protein